MFDLRNTTLEPDSGTAIWHTLWKGKFIILVVTFLATAVALGHYAKTTPIYSSRAVIMVKTPDKEMLIGELFGRLPSVRGPEALPTIETDIELLKSYPLAAETVRTLLDAQPEKPLMLFGGKTGTATFSEEEIRNFATTLQHRIRAENTRGTHLITVSVSSPSPSEAALLTNTICTTYQVKDGAWSAAQDISISNTIEKQIVAQRNKVNAIEQELSSFMKNRGIYEATGNDFRMILVEDIQAALGEAETQYNTNRVQADILKKQLAFVEERLADEEKQFSQGLVVSIGSQLRSIQKNIIEQQNDYIALNMKRGAGDPETRAALNRLNAAKAEYEKITRQKIAGELANAENAKKYRFDLIATKMQAGVRLAELDNSAQEYLKLRSQYQEQLKQLPQKQITYARLRLDLEVANRTFSFLKEKLDEARIKVASNTGRIAIITQAYPPAEPDTPDLKVNLLLGIVGGLIFGSGAVLTIEKFRPSTTMPHAPPETGNVL
ncbi:MAG: hypothetical protein FJZ79_08810 [Chlorobi bacterium]|nr:hypothetical protein [Chlorobiota bacterium]